MVMCRVCGHLHKLWSIFFPFCFGSRWLCAHGFFLLSPGDRRHDAARRNAGQVCFGSTPSHGQVRIRLMPLNALLHTFSRTEKKNRPPIFCCRVPNPIVPDRANHLFSPFSGFFDIVFLVSPLYLALVLPLDTTLLRDEVPFAEL